jgi:hypothetical protein
MSLTDTGLPRLKFSICRRNSALRGPPPETQEAEERENGHAAFRNSHAPAFRAGVRDSASGTEERWIAGFRP